MKECVKYAKKGTNPALLEMFRNVEEVRKGKVLYIFIS